MPSARVYSWVASYLALAVAWSFIHCCLFLIGGGSGIMPVSPILTCMSFSSCSKSVVFPARTVCSMPSTPQTSQVSSAENMVKCLACLSKSRVVVSVVPSLLRATWSTRHPGMRHANGVPLWRASLHMSVILSAVGAMIAKV